MTISTVSRRRRLRQLAYAPLVVAIAIGAICTAAGTSNAADTAILSMPERDFGAPDLWSLANGTDQPIYGRWTQQSGSDHVTIERRDWDALRPGDSAYGRYVDFDPFHEKYWWGYVCYKHVWRNLNHVMELFGWSSRVVLVTTESGALAAEFFDGNDSKGQVVLEANLDEPNCGGAT